MKGQRDEANKNLIRSYTTEAEARRQSRRVGQRFGTLEAIERAMRLASKVGITEAERFRLRNEAIAALALPDLRVAKEIDVPRAKENGFAVDPAFERYAFKRDDGTVVVRRMADGSCVGAGHSHGVGLGRARRQSGCSQHVGQPGRLR